MPASWIQTEKLKRLTAVFSLAEVPQMFRRLFSSFSVTRKNFQKGPAAWSIPSKEIQIIVDSSIIVRQSTNFSHGCRRIWKIRQSQIRSRHSCEGVRGGQGQCRYGPLEPAGRFLERKRPSHSTTCRTCKSRTELRADWKISSYQLQFYSLHCPTQWICKRVQWQI